MKKFGTFLCLAFWFVSFSLRAEVPAEFEHAFIGIQPGDLIFFDLHTGMSSEAVVGATREQFNSNIEISHIGLLDFSKAGELMLLEASPQVGIVRRVSLASYLSHPFARIKKIYIGRWKPEWRLAAFNAAIKSSDFLGRSFDPTFNWENDDFYCSKLIQALYTNPQNQRPLFEPGEMTFGSKGSKARDFWERYFKSLELPVPEGDLGISPLAIYLQGIEKYFVLH